MMQERESIRRIVPHGLGLILLSLGGTDLRLYPLPAGRPGFEIGQFSRVERKLGPFEIEGRKLSVVLRLQTINGAPDGFDETVESFSIVDDLDHEHFRRTFKVEVAQGMFKETVGISAWALESSGKKMIRPDTEGPKDQIADRGKTVGLLLYYGDIPSAPLSGLSCQAFRLADGRLAPTSLPLTVYGRIHDLQEGSRLDSRRLGPGETVEFGVWTGWFEVTVPVRVLDELRPVPLHSELTYGLDAYSVSVERLPQDRETFVRLFRSPDDRTPAHVIVRKDSTVEFIYALTKVALDAGDDEVVISTSDLPWLKVRIDGQEGFVRDEEDLSALGLRAAG